MSANVGEYQDALFYLVCVKTRRNAAYEGKVGSDLPCFGRLLQGGAGFTNVSGCLKSLQFYAKGFDGRRTVFLAGR